MEMQAQSLLQARINGEVNPSKIVTACMATSVGIEVVPHAQGDRILPKDGKVAVCHVWDWRDPDNPRSFVVVHGKGAGSAAVLGAPRGLRRAVTIFDGIIAGNLAALQVAGCRRGTATTRTWVFDRSE